MLWSRDRAGTIQATASHDTALQAYELRDIMPANIHLTVPRGFRKQPPAGVKLNLQDLPAPEVATRDGYRLTTPLPTLLDAASSSRSAEHLATAAQEALALGLVRNKMLEDAIEDSPITPRRGSPISGCHDHDLPHRQRPPPDQPGASRAAGGSQPAARERSVRTPPRQALPQRHEALVPQRRLRAGTGLHQQRPRHPRPGPESTTTPVLRPPKRGAGDG